LSLTALRPRRIGLYGGGFDPVHRAHLALARIALDELPLDELRWVPTGQAWHKARVLSEPLHRVAMLRLAIADPEAGDPRYRIDTSETEREGPSYTIDTVEALQAREPGAEWFLLIGQDQHAGLHTWQRWRELLARVTLAVAQRPGVVVALDPAVAAAGHLALSMPPTPVSSTLLRERLAQGQGIDDLVPPAVASYIALHRLYRPGAAEPTTTTFRS
jgi:nicotinate-nucleotide adenylyltransferase